jgi:hypothetical protein
LRIAKLGSGGTCRLRRSVQNFFEQILFMFGRLFALVGDYSLGLRSAEGQAGAAAGFFCGAEFFGFA